MTVLLPTVVTYVLSSVKLMIAIVKSWKITTTECFSRTCNTCGGTSTPMVGRGAGGTGLGGAAAGLCCCRLCRNSASRLSCSCSCSRISWSFSCVRDVGVAVLNVGGLKDERKKVEHFFEHNFFTGPNDESLFIARRQMNGHSSLCWDAKRVNFIRDNDR